jgi:uncharacterized protein YqgV (UPF0045/DUF77 family)
VSVVPRTEERPELLEVALDVHQRLRKLSLDYYLPGPVSTVIVGVCFELAGVIEWIQELIEEQAEKSEETV